MGLDMFAYTTLENPAGSVDFKVGEATEIHYWRKHPNLHGWMEKLYRDKGGSQESFNCVNLQLAQAGPRQAGSRHQGEAPAAYHRLLLRRV